jgi:hypothetical protein
MVGEDTRGSSGCGDPERWLIGDDGRFVGVF